MLLGFLVEQRIAANAFDRLEADQIAQDAQRLRLGLESGVTLLHNYGATNSIWDSSFGDVARSDEVGFLADFSPHDLRTLYGLDGVLAVGPDGALRLGGLAEGDTYRRPPAGLISAPDLARLFDATAQAGSGRCGVTSTSAGPYLFCGFAAHEDDGGSAISGGLIYLKSLNGQGLESLGRQLAVPLTLAAGTGSSSAGESSSGGATLIDSSIGRLQVRTHGVSSSRMLLEITVPALGGSVRLQAVQPRHP